MNFDFIKQRQPERIAVGDEIAVYPEGDDDFTPAGRYTVAQLLNLGEGAIEVTLVGMGHLEGHISVVEMSGGE